MSGRFEIANAAEEDLNKYADYLLAEADAQVSARFSASARTTFQKLADQPGMGPSLDSRNPTYASIRKWRVAKFPKTLIFYIPIENGVRIVRVLHAAQDWWTLLDAH